MEAHRVDQDAGLVDRLMERELLGDLLLRRHRARLRPRRRVDEDHEPHRWLRGPHRSVLRSNRQSFLLTKRRSYDRTTVAHSRPLGQQWETEAIERTGDLYPVSAGKVVILWPGM
jgi:hypothetical protein